ncbi:MAG TPA: nuclear transport factor 2 family protein, partial [Thermoanaerobaculia bacterium]|nr:nuclear transport factor 2 family protein [Thermoanaerobaculia bacterium]
MLWNEALIVGTLAATALAAPPAASSPDADAIRQTALDYIEGWYEGDASRMERALHPELAKRIVFTDPSGQNTLSQMSAMTLVQRTREGMGKNDPAKQKDVTILDIYENTAMVKIVATDWIDYLKEARWNGQWKIVNVLWEL